MLSNRQQAELDFWSRTHPQPGMRLKALAVRAVAHGHSRQLVGAILHVSAYTVGQWYRSYQQKGWAVLQIHAGRGRHSRINPQEVEDFVRQSLRNFGIARTRWTLQLLAQTVPGLQGLCPSAVWHTLRRLGLSYKRAEPWLHSPDPDYVKKKLYIQALSAHARQAPQDLRLFYLDEASFYRQPTQAWLWAERGHSQPRLRWSYRSNRVVRVARPWKRWKVGWSTVWLPASRSTN
jgi:transposase